MIWWQWLIGVVVFGVMTYIAEAETLAESVSLALTILCLGAAIGAALA